VLDATPKEVAVAAPEDSGLTNLGLIVAGTGAALIGVGALVDVLVVGPAIDDYEAAVVAGSNDDKSLRDDAETQQLTVMVLYGLGGAAVVAGLTMTLLDVGYSEAPSGEAAGFGSWISPHGAGVSWGASW
jgi:hypothetical protein